MRHDRFRWRTNDSRSGKAVPPHFPLKLPSFRHLHGPNFQHTVVRRGRRYFRLILRLTAVTTETTELFRGDETSNRHTHTSTLCVACEQQDLSSTHTSRAIQIQPGRLPKLIRSQSTQYRKGEKAPDRVEFAPLTSLRQTESVTTAAVVPYGVKTEFRHWPTRLCVRPCPSAKVSSHDQAISSYCTTAALSGALPNRWLNFTGSV